MTVVVNAVGPGEIFGLCERVYKRAPIMTETLSIRIDADTKKRLDALAERSKRSKSFLAAEAIAAYIESEEWQLGELHEKVSKWLKSWGGETVRRATFCAYAISLQ